MKLPRRCISLNWTLIFVSTFLALSTRQVSMFGLSSGKLAFGTVQDNQPGVKQTQQQGGNSDEEFPNVSNRLIDVSGEMRQWTSQYRDQIVAAIVEAYCECVEFGSSDRVLIEADLREEFVDAVARRLAAKKAGVESRELTDATVVWRLLSLRKRGDLPKQDDKRKGNVKRKPTVDEKIQAEVASRRSEEWFDATLDRILVDSNGREFFDTVVGQLQAKSSTGKLDRDPEETKAYLDHIRRIALGLRKARRLRPELSARLIDWEIRQLSFPAKTLLNDLNLVPETPGIYLFRDSTGYLYIGEAIDLRQRMKQHLSESDREQLALYLDQTNLEQVQIDFHAFPIDSPGRKLGVRRAYESELIRSRKPRFNIRP